MFFTMFCSKTLSWLDIYICCASVLSYNSKSSAIRTMSGFSSLNLLLLFNGTHPTCENIYLHFNLQLIYLPIKSCQLLFFQNFVVDVSCPLRLCPPLLNIYISASPPVDISPHRKLVSSVLPKSSEGRPMSAAALSFSSLLNTSIYRLRANVPHLLQKTPSILFKIPEQVDDVRCALFF